MVGQRFLAPLIEVRVLVPQQNNEESRMLERIYFARGTRTRTESDTKSALYPKW